MIPIHRKDWKRYDFSNQLICSKLGFFFLGFAENPKDKKSVKDMRYCGRVRLEKLRKTRDSAYHNFFGAE